MYFSIDKKMLQANRLIHLQNSTSLIKYYKTYMLSTTVKFYKNYFDFFLEQGL